MKKGKRLLVSVAASFLLAATAVGIIPSGTKAETVGNTASLRILETTDLHSNIMPYDYYQDKDNQSYGLAKTATLIKEAREGAVNSLLFDAGDTIQGTPLATYAAKNLQAGEIHPMFQAMNSLDYDAAIVGNHEFNYGLDYLNQVLKGAEFDVVNANVYDAATGDNYFTPYKILNREIMDDNGHKSTIKVGVIGFVPPQIMNWDKFYLDGKVTVKGITETARKFIPQMKAEGADIIVAIAHSGCDLQEEDDQAAENAVYELTKVPDIDVMLFGHAHQTFPSPSFSKTPLTGIDYVNGFINGVPATEAGKWGDHLGVIDLNLVQDANGKWTVDKQAAKVTTEAVTAATAVDQGIADGAKNFHEATIRYVNEKIGQTTNPMFSFFARVTDDASLQFINEVQMDYAKNWLKTQPELSGLPVLSAAAPFKNNTNVAVGDLSIKSATDLYNFDNTIKAVKMTGAQVKEWLEFSASNFKQIDPAKTESQELLDTSFAGYLYDVIDGVKYQVDVTQPRRYNFKTGALENAAAHRVINFTMMDGTPITEDQEFIVVTNNYRAGGGGNFPGLVDGAAPLVLDSTEEIRDIMMDYIRDKGVISPVADQNWSIAPIAGNVTLTFTSPVEGTEYLDMVPNIKAVGEASGGSQTYQLVFANGEEPGNDPVQGGTENNGTPSDNGNGTPSDGRQKENGTPSDNESTASNAGSVTDKAADSDNEGKALPKTATAMYDYLLLGLLVVISGVVLYIRKRQLH
ncbi:bifunctional 2',3'-cyclic-nucleotide 2'-phosphodiesterase/3'-nucleotidase [Neobacillus muris]|uniref:bifunctional 2',3'-cyclic-nucleotide 2'-phosphodiesterase/3'-nucleotidase n=1 Tax=Neobacillus muris TaxID=2941334 RepID=UPI00203E42FF|nr:bifunctional 2',3'-cyclic-nucleotide 2'-phosphodiesterase/3'-nucleotidase [Neobacillus muris]